MVGLSTASPKLLSLSNASSNISLAESAVMLDSICAVAGVPPYLAALIALDFNTQDQFLDRFTTILISLSHLPQPYVVRLPLKIHYNDRRNASRLKANVVDTWNAKNGLWQKGCDWCVGDCEQVAASRECPGGRMSE